MKILIDNIDIIPMTKRDLVLENSCIEIDGEKIISVGSKTEGFKPDKIIDGKDKLAIPGLINAHTHMGMSYMRNYADDLDLMDWLQDEIWPLEAKLTREDIYYSSKLSMLESIKSGITTFVDMYFEMDRVGDAALEIGMRGVLTPGYIEDDRSEQRIEAYRRLYENYDGKSGLLKVMIAPHAPYTVGKEHLFKLIELSKELNTGIHIHLAETEFEEKEAYKNFGMSTIKYIDSLGLFEQPTIAAHCVHVDDEDIEIMAEKNVHVVHNPSSNLKLASGFAKVQQMLDAGVKLALGTDGSSSNNNLNMIEEMHIASIMAKAVSKNPKALSAYDTLKMATMGGAEAIGMGKQLGAIEAGRLADISIIDLNKIHLKPINNKISLVVYSAQASDIDTVIINGNIVMESRKIIGVDENEIIEEVDYRMKRLRA
ncbi:MAG: amidohydrolase [Tissierellia bacterium]|nr:amidohydrolase [Tissierellia bacterium]